MHFIWCLFLFKPRWLCINFLPVLVQFKIKSAYQYLPVKELIINDRNCIHWIICETIALSYAPLKSTIALILNCTCINHRPAQFVYFILFRRIVDSLLLRAVQIIGPCTSTPTRGAEDLASHQYERVVLTVRRILLLSSAIPVPTSSHQYERAEAASSLQFRLSLSSSECCKILKPSHSLAGLCLRESISSALY
jgi:hypothetical protein